MKNFIKIIFSLMLVSASVIFVPTSVIATDGSDTTTEGPSDQPIDEPSDDDTEKPGSEWSGEIKDPAGDNITEPSTPVTPPAPEVTVTEVITTVTPPTTTSQTVSTPIPTPVTATTTENTTAETQPTDTPVTTEEESEPETMTPEDFVVLVPDTNTPKNVEKIRLLALLSTTIVVFSSLFVYLIFQIIKLKPAEVKVKIKTKTPKKSPKIPAKDTNPLLNPTKSKKH